MHISDKLLGLDYPVKDENGNIVLTRKITKVLEIENSPAVLIGLDGKEPSILIGYLEVTKLINKE